MTALQETTQQPSVMVGEQSSLLNNSQNSSSRPSYSQQNSSLTRNNFVPHAHVRDVLDDSIGCVVMKPVNVSSVDKRLQDHTSLYNSLVDQWRRLESLVTELRRMFPEDNVHQKLDDTFRHLNHITYACESVTMVRPRPDALCPQINYDGREVPYQAIPAFISYNTAVRYIHELLDKAPSVTGSVQLVLNDERQLERDILVASLGRDAPTAMQNYRHNVEALRWTVIPAIAELERRTRAIAAELVKFEKLRGSSVTPVDA